MENHVKRIVQLEEADKRSKALQQRIDRLQEETVTLEARLHEETKRGDKALFEAKRAKEAVSRLEGEKAVRGACLECVLSSVCFVWCVRSVWCACVQWMGVSCAEWLCFVYALRCLSSCVSFPHLLDPHRGARGPSDEAHRA